MAIDTAAKRFAMIEYAGCDVHCRVPEATDYATDEGRYAALFLYGTGFYPEGGAAGSVNRFDWVGPFGLRPRRPAAWR